MAGDELSFTPAEQSYFDSKGQTAIPDAPAEVVEQAKPEAATETPSKTDTPHKPAEGEPKADPEPEALKVVDKRALDEERSRRKATAKERDEARQQMARLQGQLDALTKPVTQEPQGDPIDTDPIAALKRLDEAEKGREQARQQHEYEGALQAKFKADIDQFTTTKPDYMAAADFLMKSREAELRLFTDDPAAIAAALRRETISIVDRAAHTEKNAAEIAYAMATARGYKVAAAEDPAPKVSDSEKMDNIAKGQAASKNLSSPGNADATPTITSLLAMDSEEFLKATTDPKAWRKFAGG